MFLVQIVSCLTRGHQELSSECRDVLSVFPSEGERWLSVHGGCGARS